jgi:hypothetical protein
MPETLEAQDLQDEQKNGSELKDQLEAGHTSLRLQKLSTDVTMSIYHDISTRCVIPYIPALLQQKVFAIVHNSSHPVVKQRANNCGKNTFGAT